jgi:hypothetical protein
VSGEQENLEERFLRIVEEEELTEGHSGVEDE